MKKDNLRENNFAYLKEKEDKILLKDKNNKKKNKKDRSILEKKVKKSQFKKDKSNTKQGKISGKLKNIKPIRHISRYFIPSVLLLLMVTVFVGSFLAKIINDLLHVNFEFTVYIWNFLFSIIIGGFFSFIITKLFFNPMDTLNKSMGKVADGDYSVKIDEHSIVNEIQCMYNNFNVMVKELSSTEILQSDFISNVSHEFKTPIGAIEGYLTLLQDSNISEEEKQEYIEKIMVSTKRLSGLIGNILLLSKVENKKIDSNKKVYRIDEQIRQCIVMLEPKWSEKNIEPDIDLEDIEYLGNEGLLSHVWMNLIDNAIKFGKEGGYIKIRLKRTDGNIVFSVEDNGDGLTDEEKKHIFDKFYQCDNSHKSQGNGLGLSLVKRIVDTAGAEITVENGESGGCLFTVSVGDPNN